MDHDSHRPEQPDRDPAGDPDLPAGSQPGDTRRGRSRRRCRCRQRGGDSGEGTAPFGLPVLAELPELTGLLEDLVAVDRLLARALDTLVLLEDTGQVETATGVGIGQWLSIVARRTGSDVRMLRCAVRACRRLPSLHAGFRDGQLSWAQLRVVALKVERAPLHTDLALDAKVADAIDTCRDAEPDALARMVGWAIAELADPPDKPDKPAPALGEGFLHLQPRLDGTGGSVFGELDAYSFALLDAATAPQRPPATGPTRDRFAGPTDPDQAAHAGQDPGPSTARPAPRPPHQPRRRRRRGHAERPDRQRSTATTRRTTAADGTGDVGSVAGGQPGGRGVAVKLLLRAELDTLLGNSHLPSQLLTTLAGGAMHLDAAAARRLADAGAEVRLIVTDRGRIVGVGRQSRVPPGWLRDATLSLHDTCTAPGCERAALSSQVDHAVPWDEGGHTDIGNCGPLCGHDNHTKETAGWKATGQPDGTRHWHHPRSGLQITTHPSTKRPPPRPDHPSRRGNGADDLDADLATAPEGHARGSGGREPPHPPPPEHPPDG
jgi:hypothetical protein